MDLQHITIYFKLALNKVYGKMKKTKTKNKNKKLVQINIFAPAIDNLKRGLNKQILLSLPLSLLSWLLTKE